MVVYYAYVVIMNSFCFVYCFFFQFPFFNVFLFVGRCLGGRKRLVGACMLLSLFVRPSVVSEILTDVLNRRDLRSAEAWLCCALHENI